MLFHWLYYRLLVGIFFIFVGLLRAVPPPLFRRLSTPLLKLSIYLLVPRRRIVRNLDAAFGEAYAAATKNGLAKGVQEHFVKNLMDCFFQLRRPGHARDSVTIHGIENLEAALAKGKGVIALGAHIGNFVLVGTRLGIEGYPFSALFRIPPDEGIRAIFERYLLPHFYQQIISSRPRRLAVRLILAALKKNEIVFILADNLKKGKVKTRLFGRQVSSPRGPVSLALRSEAAMVPLYLVRSYEGGLELIIEPEVPMHRTGSLIEDIGYNTERIVRYLERLIRRYPDQWNWLTIRMKRYTPTPEGQEFKEIYETSDLGEL